MKRILLALVMAGGLALAVASMANAAAPAECGHSYAFQVHGTEPSATNDAALLYAVGVGQITFGTGATTGFGPSGTSPGCTVSSGEMIYNDNDILGFFAGPAVCGGIPCFDGGNHMTGSLIPSANGNGAANLSIVASFAWLNGGPASTSLPLSFTLQPNTGASTVLGNSVALSGAGTPPLPTGTPPANPVLSITLQKQSTMVTPPSTAGSNYGTAPYLGLSAISCEGFGAPSGDKFAQPITGSFGSAVGALQIFPGGLAGGSLSFNANDNVGNTTGATNDDCDFNSTQLGAYADGTSNSQASIIHQGRIVDGVYIPTLPNLNCADASAAAVENTSNVVWGATDTSSYQIVTAVGNAKSGGLVPPGEEVTCTTLPSTPAGYLHSTNTAAVSLTSNGMQAAKNINLTNTSPAGCDVSITMPTAGDGTCYLSLAAPSLISGPVALVEGDTPSNTTSGGLAIVVEGDTASTVYATINCNCTKLAKGGTADSISTSVLVTSNNCLVSVGGTSETVTCKN
jgi:hypothetical protein